MKSTNIETLILKTGNHPSNDGMCVMEAVAFFANESHSDHPTCACPVISTFIRSVNDWCTHEQRQDLKRFILPMIGTKGTLEVEIKRAEHFARYATAAANAAYWTAADAATAARYAAADAANAARYIAADATTTIWQLTLTCIEEAINIKD